MFCRLKIILVFSFISIQVIAEDTQLKVLCYPEGLSGACEIGQGEARLLKIVVNNKNVQAIKLVAFGNEFDCNPIGKTQWICLVAADLDQGQGDYLLKLELISGLASTYFSFPIKVKRIDRPIEELTLPPEMVILSEEVRKLVRNDNIAISRAFRNTKKNFLWKGEFIKPVPGEITSYFGTKRIINGIKKSPHSGVDYKAEIGEDVKATNDGKVVLVRDCYLSGNTLIIDHGAKLFSMYFHLDEVFVSTGDFVSKGEIIGKAGMTGRATGPHLHFGMRLGRTKIDPCSILELAPYLRP